MVRERTRRRFLTTGVAACGVGIAGCSGLLGPSDESTDDGSDDSDDGGADDAGGDGESDGDGGSGDESASGGEDSSGSDTVWPRFGRTLGRTGYTPGSGPVEGVAEAWTFDLPAGDERIPAAPVVTDETAYVHDSDGNLYALSTEDGQRRWEADAGSGAQGVAVTDDRVFARDDGLVAFDPEMGEREWSTEYGGSRSGRLLVAEVAAGEADTPSPTVFGARDDSVLFAADAADGTELWTFETSGYVWTAPALADGTVYVGSSGIVYAVNAETGHKEWHVETTDPVKGAPALADGTLYVADRNGVVFAFDAASGDEQWRTSLSGGIYGSPAVADGRVYVGTWGEEVHALDAASGERQWTFDTDGQIDAGPVVAGETLYATSNDGYVYALEASTGSFLWRYQTAGAINAAPVVAGGRVYVGDTQGRLHVLERGTTSGSNPNELTDLTVDEAWPSRQFDTANTGAAPRAGPVDGAEERWDAMLPGEAGPPVVVDGSVYAVSANGQLSVVDAATGEETESFSHEDLNEPSAVADGRLYSVVGRFVNAFDVAEQRHVWKTGVGDVVGRPVATADGPVLASESPDYDVEGMIGRLDPGSGDLQWRTDFGQTPTAGPALADGTAYVGMPDGVVAVDATDGAEQWRAETGAEVDVAPTVADGVVFVPEDDGSVRALDAASGESQWTASLPESPIASAAVADGTVVVPDWNGAIHALSAADGSERWTFETDESGNPPAPVVGDGVVYTTTGDYRFRAIDLESGDELWRASPSGFAAFTPPAIVNGLVVTAFGAELIAYQEAGE